MGFNANQFRANFSSGFARNNMFKVEIPNPPINFNTTNIEFACIASELPGKQIATAEYKDYGLVRKIPYGAIFDDASLEFLVDGQMSQKLFIDQWMEHIVDNTGSSDVEYYDNLNTNVIITQYSPTGSVIYKIELEEAYPVAVEPLTLSWENKDDIHRVRVSFAYRNWRRI